MKWVIATLGIVGNLGAIEGYVPPKWAPVVTALASLALALNHSLAVNTKSR